MDGSARPFLQAIDRSGLCAQSQPRRWIEVIERVEVIDGDKRATLCPPPARDSSWTWRSPSPAQRLAASIWR